MYLTTRASRNSHHGHPAAVLQKLFGTFKAHALTPSVIAQGKQRLTAVSQALSKKKDELARLMSLEGHRGISACTQELDRAFQTLDICGQALEKIAAPLDYDFRDALQGGKIGVSERFTYAPLFAIVPFNFPVNLALHKIAPALALGIPFACKGPLTHPKTNALLHDCLLDAGIVNEGFCFLDVENDEIAALLDALPHCILSFTGSRPVGETLLSKYAAHKVILELGGTAFALVLDDTKPFSDLAKACARSAFGNSGQSCISLQHIIVDEKHHAQFVTLLKDEAQRISQSKDPLSPETICSRLINTNAFTKTMRILSNVRERGLHIWHADKVDDAQCYIPPTIIECSAKSFFPNVDLYNEEVFSPLVFVHSCRGTPDAIVMANALDANIHGSVFCGDQKTAEHVFFHTQVRSLLWNEAPSWRADSMPYGGFLTQPSPSTLERVHNGLVGNEGPLQTLHDYTIDRLFVFKR